MGIINEFAYGESFSRVDIYVELLQRQKINWTVVIHGSCIFESFGRKTSIDKYHHFHLNFFMQNGEEISQPARVCFRPNIWQTFNLANKSKKIYLRPDYVMNFF